jgi:hypothetical protein
MRVQILATAELVESNVLAGSIARQDDALKTEPRDARITAVAMLASLLAIPTESMAQTHSLFPNGRVVEVSVAGRPELLAIGGLHDDEPFLYRKPHIGAWTRVGRPDSRWVSLPLQMGTGLALASPATEAWAADRVYVVSGFGTRLPSPAFRGRRPIGWACRCRGLEAARRLSTARRGGRSWKGARFTSPGGQST